MNFQLKSYDCKVCGSGENRYLYTIKNFRIVQCKKCSFVYVSPRIADEDLASIYTTNYFNNTSFGYEEYELTAALRIKNFAHWFSVVEPYTDPNKGKVLDIGCAAGYFLDILKGKGWDIYGIELDKEMVAKLQQRGVPVSDKTFEEYPTDNKFKLITLFDVLEHLPDTHGTIKKLASLLDDKGVIALITPDYNSTQRKIFGKRWFQFKPHEHIHYFSPTTLKRVLEPYGLKILHYEKGGQFADVNFLLNRLERYGFRRMSKLFGWICGMLGWKDKFWYADTGSMFVVIGK